MIKSILNHEHLLPIFKSFLPQNCLSCDRKIIDDKKLCRVCRSLIFKMPSIKWQKFDTGSLSFFAYEKTIKNLVIKAKFMHDKSAAILLTNLFAENLPAIIHSDLRIACITYVPTTWPRMFKRGFDLSFMIAKKAGILLNAPIKKMIRPKILKPTFALGTSKKERIILSKKYLRSTFDPNMKYESILLLDDIITSGATINTAKNLLKPIAKNIYCLSLAKAI